MGWDQPHELARAVHHRDARLVLSHHRPGHALLVDCRRDDRRIVVHQLGKPSVLGGGNENLDRDDADESFPLEDGHVVRAVVAGARHSIADVPRRLLGTGHRDASGRVLARDAKAVGHAAILVGRPDMASAEPRGRARESPDARAAAIGLDVCQTPDTGPALAT